MKRALLSLAVALLFALTTTRLMPDAGARGKPSSDIPVTVTIDGLGVNTSTLRIQSDLAGVYRNSSSLQSMIQGIGDWEFDMLNFSSSPQRKVS